VNFAAITLCVASQQVFIVVRVYFVIDSVRKLLDTPSYTEVSDQLHAQVTLVPRKEPPITVRLEVVWAPELVWT
jgi:hypothetical protein